MPRNAEQNQLVRDSRRDQILSAALGLFASKGLAATKIAQIAAASGISQGLLYHYFRSKEDAFVEIIRDAFEKMNASARELEALPISPKEKITRAVSEMLHSLQTNERFALTILLIAQATMSESIPRRARSVMRKESGVPYEVVARILRAGQEDGTIKKHDPDQLSLVFWTMIKGLALHKASFGPAFTAPDARILTSVFFEEE